MAGRRPRLLTLSAKESLILELLVRDREMYGLQLVAESRRRLKRGTVYVTLGRMEEKGFVTSHLEDEPPAQGGMPRRLYEPTAYGRELLAAWTTAHRRLRMRFAQCSQARRNLRHARPHGGEGPRLVSDRRKRAAALQTDRAR